MTAYCLFDNIEVTDPQRLAEYASRVGEIVARHGARYLATGGRVEVIEGSPTLHQPVLIEFPSLTDAHAWYNAPDYQELKQLRHSAVRTTAVFFETPGVDLPTT